MNSRFLTEVGDFILLSEFEKHAPGKHNQKTHAGSRGGPVYEDLKVFLDDKKEKDLASARKIGLEYAYEYSDKQIEAIVEGQYENGAPLFEKEPKLVDAVYRYQTSTGRKVNEALRDPQISEEGYSKIIDNLDKAIEDAPALRREITVYRGVSKNVGRDNEFWSRLEEGDVVTDLGYTSFSLNPEVAGTFSYASQSKGAQGFIFELKLPAGTKGLFPNSVHSLLTSFMNEAEFILPRGTQFEILSREGKVWQLGVVSD